MTKEEMEKTETVVTLEMLERLISRNPHQDRGEPIKVLLDLPSVGSRSYSIIRFASFGFDWDRGLLLKPSAKLVPKNENQDIFEDAYELLLYIATKPLKKESYEIKKAKRILARYGKDQDYLDKIQKFFHKEFT